MLRWRTLTATMVALCVLVTVAAAATAQPVSTPPAAPSATASSAAAYEVGAAKVSITPRSLRGIHLGGYGIGPVHPAKGVLRPIYARALAVRDARTGAQVVITSLDLQGHFLAYRNGPYGFADMAATLHQQLGIPVANLLFQTTHTHNGPDDLGVWGGVPTSYLRFVTRQTERAVRTAVHRETAARLRWASIQMPNFASTFSRTGDSDDPSTDGDKNKFPVDETLNVLQAVDAGNGRVLATLVDFACHATIYGPLDKVSPDWPGATATYLEHDQRGMRTGVRYGWPGSVAVVVEGDLGHTWPGGIPRFADPGRTPSKATDDNYPADAFGDAIARAATTAITRHPRRVRGPVAGTARSITVANDNPVLLAALVHPVDGITAYRADTPPYGAGDAITTTVAEVRIGQLLFAGAPGEEYPTLGFALRKAAPSAVVLPVSLADDQLGYMGTPEDYAEAQECSLTDEGFFTISPILGDEVLSAQEADTSALGFPVHAGPAFAERSPLSLSVVCATSQL